MELRSANSISVCSSRQQSEAEDRISALPDDLLILVLADLRCAAAAAHTSVLSRRWGGLWTRLHQIAFCGVPFPSLEAALGRIDSPAVSLLEIHVPQRQIPGVRQPDPVFIDSLLRAAARLAPEKFAFHLRCISTNAQLPCFYRATSIVLDSRFLLLRVPSGVGFPVLETLSLSGCVVKKTCFLSHEEDPSVHSASLQELAMQIQASWLHRVDIVAPRLSK